MLPKNRFINMDLSRIKIDQYSIADLIGEKNIEKQK